MERRSHILATLIVSSSFALSGCLAPQSVATTNLIAAASSASATAASMSGDLYLKVSTAWEETPDTWVDKVTCQIPLGSATVLSTCSGTVPEGQLHFSKIKFTVGTTNPTACKIVIFRPYYYMLSTGAAYTPPWGDTAIDCSTDPTADCYDGVALDIVPSFPDFTALYYLTTNALENQYEATSSNLKLRNATNRWTCNNKVDQTAGVANYVASSMQNYVLECRDEYYTLQKRITLTFGDADLEAGEFPGNGAIDDFDDWLAP